MEKHLWKSNIFSKIAYQYPATLLKCHSSISVKTNYFPGLSINEPLDKYFLTRSRCRFRPYLVDC